MATSHVITRLTRRLVCLKPRSSSTTDNLHDAETVTVISPYGNRVLCRSKRTRHHTFTNTGIITGTVVHYTAPLTPLATSRVGRCVIHTMRQLTCRAAT